MKNKYLEIIADGYHWYKNKPTVNDFAMLYVYAGLSIFQSAFLIGVFFILTAFDLDILKFMFDEKKLNNEILEILFNAFKYSIVFVLPFIVLIYFLVRNETNWNIILTYTKSDGKKYRFFVLSAFFFAMLLIILSGIIYDLNHA